MKHYTVVMDIMAECEDDVRELIHDYTGVQTEVCISKIVSVTDKDTLERKWAEKKLRLLRKESRQFQAGYLIMMDYLGELNPESQADANKRLKAVKL